MVVTRPLISQGFLYGATVRWCLTQQEGRGLVGSGGRRSQLLYKVDQLWNAKRIVYSLCLLWSSLRTEYPKIISVCSLQAVGCREHWLWSLRPGCEFHFHHNYQWDHRQAVLSPTASVSSSKKRRESWVAGSEKLEKKKKKEKTLWDFF